jgi:lipopolysaccharide/colanic/teichoic acid biosynthesis glycosyltransferase
MAKRLFDLACSALALLVAAIPMAIIAGVVRLSMGAPVLFRHQRPGLDGRLFDLIKFRTMRTGDGSDADRLTVLGRFLRSTSLDELPELWNVLKGDMSLVGPRPLHVHYLDLYSPRQARRHEVRPGITGLAQVNGRNLVDWDERLELDVRYVETHTMLGDLKIIGRTIGMVLRREGISEEGEATMGLFQGSDR